MPIPFTLINKESLGVKDKLYTTDTDFVYFCYMYYQFEWMMSHDVTIYDILNILSYGYDKGVEHDVICEGMGGEEVFAFLRLCLKHEYKNDFLADVQEFLANILGDEKQMESFLPQELIEDYRAFNAFKRKIEDICEKHLGEGHWHIIGVNGSLNNEQRYDVEVAMFDEHGEMKKKSLVIYNGIVFE